MDYINDIATLLERINSDEWSESPSGWVKYGDKGDSSDAYFDVPYVKIMDNDQYVGHRVFRSDDEADQFLNDIIKDHPDSFKSRGVINADGDVLAEGVSP